MDLPSFWGLGYSGLLVGTVEVDEALSETSVPPVAPGGEPSEVFPSSLVHGILWLKLCTISLALLDIWQYRNIQ
jgi:hypothetical protein